MQMWAGARLSPSDVIIVGLFVRRVDGFSTANPAIRVRIRSAMMDRAAYRNKLTIGNWIADSIRNSIYISKSRKTLRRCAQIQ